MSHKTNNLSERDLSSPHSFHIPVMGTGYTIDTPLRVAKFGISSVVSLVDDVLIEQMRKFHCEKYKEPYKEIDDSDEDARAHRITAYLNLLDKIVKRQTAELQNSPFEKSSDITKYYEMLPDSPLKLLYQNMITSTNQKEKEAMQKKLRKQVVPGNIDVNIMTKLNAAVYQKGIKRPIEFNDAMAALRGYAKSNLHSSIVFSAGLNQRLYTYITNFKDFFPDENGIINKKIILKVSDYRSAFIQGKFLAKRCLWVSEFRVESGLNCGGHAFATKGYLMGPILEEFKQKREILHRKLHTIYNKARELNYLPLITTPHNLRITAQGGIGTSHENEFLLKYYAVDSTGWATPFMLVPDIVNIDELHLKKLQSATADDVYLSENSPLNVPFWNLYTSESEILRRKRIKEGNPGSPCPKHYTVANTDFTKTPICLASRAYQKLKLKHLQKENFTSKLLSILRDNVLSKSCICHDLAGVVTLKHGIDPNAAPAVCCGPNIVHFSKLATLEDMVNHIYGRISLLCNKNRKHMFVQELTIYVEYLQKEIEKLSQGLISQTPKYFNEFKENLLKGIKYYRQIASQLVDKQQERFLSELQLLQEQIEYILPDTLTPCIMITEK